MCVCVCEWSCLQGLRWFCFARTKVLLARPSLSCGSLLLVCVGSGSRQVQAWPDLRERVGLVTRLALAVCHVEHSVFRSFYERSIGVNS